MRLLPASLASAFVLCIAPGAMAQDSAAADALFDKGLSEMKAGQFDTGCPKLAESHRLDPRAGTLFTLAECEAQGGKLASALVHYEDYLRVFARMSAKERAGQRGREDVAKEAIARLTPEVPTLALRLPPGAPPDAVVVRNGTRLGSAALGVPLPVNPGEQHVVVELDGRRSEQRIAIAKGEKKELVLELPAPEQVAPASAPPAAAAPSAPARPTKSRSNALAYVAGGIGLAGIAVGSVTGAMVFGKKGTIDDHCDGKACDQQGLDAADSAKTLGLVSTIGFGVGAVGLATATVLLLTGSSSEAPADRATALRPAVGALPGGGFASVRGAF